MAEENPAQFPQDRPVKMEHCPDKAARFARENGGIAWKDAIAAARVVVAAKFDADCREIVARGWLDGADESVRLRIAQLGIAQ